MRVQPIQGRREWPQLTAAEWPPLFRGGIIHAVSQYLLALSCVFALSAVQSSFAQDRAAMESYACNYVEGKGLDDLMAVAAKWASGHLRIILRLTGRMS